MNAVFLTSGSARKIQLGGYDRKPSSFYVRFLMEGIEYEYGFSMTRTGILTEQLYYYPNGRRSLVFSRDERKGPEKKDVYEFKLLLIDEIDTSLHTQLVEFIIGMFNASERAQLVYTSHNTHLLNTDFQRRDQVYFVNKREDGSRRGVYFA